VPENHLVVGALKREGHPAGLIDVSKLRRVMPKKGILVATMPSLNSAADTLRVDITEYLVWDTMIAEYVIYGNQRVPLDLDSVCKRWGLLGKERVIDALMQGGVCPSQMPQHLLSDAYCATWTRQASCSCGSFATCRTMGCFRPCSLAAS